MVLRSRPEHDQRRPDLRGQLHPRGDGALPLLGSVGLSRRGWAGLRSPRPRSPPPARAGRRPRQPDRGDRAARRAPARAGAHLPRDGSGAAPDRGRRRERLPRGPAERPYSSLHLRREHRAARLRGAHLPFPLSADPPAGGARLVVVHRHLAGSLLHHGGELAPGRQGRRVARRDLHVEQAPRVPQDHRPAPPDGPAPGAGPRGEGPGRRRGDRVGAPGPGGRRRHRDPDPARMASHQCDDAVP